MTVKFEPDLYDLEKVCRLHPTDKDLAAYFGVSAKTIQRKKKNKAFREAMEKGFGHANLSLRRKQMEIALGGSVPMLIWLGKQLLEQAEKVDQTIESSGLPDMKITVIGENGQPIETV